MLRHGQKALPAASFGAVSSQATELLFTQFFCLSHDAGAPLAERTVPENAPRPRLNVYHCLPDSKARATHTQGGDSSHVSSVFPIGVCCSVDALDIVTAGIGIAGVVGAICVVLSSHGLATLPLRGASLVLMLIAMFALAIDVQVGIPRFFTGLGLVLFTISSVTLFRPSDGGDVRLSWLTLASGVATISLAFVVGMPSMVRTRFATPTIGREWMIGSIGVAVGEINPLGIVRIHDANWRARTNRSTPINDGQELKVAAIDGVTLEVEPLEGAARDYREMRKPK